MSIGTILLILLVVILLGGFHPSLAYSYSPLGGGALGLVLIIVLIAILLGKL